MTSSPMTASQQTSSESEQKKIRKIHKKENIFKIEILTNVIKKKVLKKLGHVPSGQEDHRQDLPEFKKGSWK